MTYTAAATSRYELTIGDGVHVDCSQQLEDTGNADRCIEYIAVNRRFWITPGTIAMHVPIGSIVTVTHRGKSVDAMLVECDDVRAVLALPDEKRRDVPASEEKTR